MSLSVLRWPRAPVSNRPLRPTRATSAAGVVVWVSIWIGSVSNAALWRELFSLGSLGAASGFLLLGGLAAGIMSLVAALSSLFAWRWTLKPFLVLMLLVSAGCANFMLSYKIVIDPTMMVNVLQTDPHEAMDLLNHRLALNLLVLGGLPSVWVLMRPVDYGPFWVNRLKWNLMVLIGGLLLTVFALLACFQPLASTLRNHKEVRYLINPLNVMYALASVAFTGPVRSAEVQPIGQDAALAAMPSDPAHPPLLVLVLGETGRAGNFGTNGYGRDTTPGLRQAQVISFKNVWSCGTSTAASVPCMFSRLPRAEFFHRAHEEEGLLDVLQRAGYAVLWIDNQAGCKGVCDRVPHVSTQPASSPALCSAGECLDGIMLEGLDERLAQLPSDRRSRGVVLVLHQMGSHGPAYHHRSSRDTKRFLPECESSQLQDCTHDQLVNAYDNSIAYTDHMLRATIDWLGHQASHWSPALLYVADHGESLGENNLYLHGLPYAVAPDVQKRVPWISWLSDRFSQHAGLDRACLMSRLETPLSHDHYFHSVLGLMAVRTSVYDNRLDAYAPCKTSFVTGSVPK